jgi:hypothetical protein
MKLANGSSVTCDQQVRELSWLTQGYTLTIDRRVIELGVKMLCSAIGIVWIQSYSAIFVD